MSDAAPQPGGRRPKLSEVAARAGVSQGTVSNVLNHPGRVTPGTTRKVRRAIADLAYARNDLASALARGSTSTIGLVVIGLGNSLFVDVARAAQRSARSQQRYLQLAMAEDDPALLEDHMAVLTGQGVSGLLVAPMAEIGDAVARSRRLGRPVVLLNFDPEHLECCRVLVDNERVGQLAAEHLIELGRRRVAFVGGDDRLQPIRLRRRGVRAAVAAAGGVRLDEVAARTFEPKTGAAAARALLDRPAHERPDGVVAASDLLAMALIGELRAAGLRVPEDVAVVGCDHNSAAWGGAVPLTSVTMEGDAMGAEGVRLLVRELAEDPADHVHTKVVLEPRLLARESTVGRTR